MEAEKYIKVVDGVRLRERNLHMTNLNGTEETEPLIEITDLFHLGMRSR